MLQQTCPGSCSVIHIEQDLETREDPESIAVRAVAAAVEAASNFLDNSVKIARSLMVQKLFNCGGSGAN